MYNDDELYGHFLAGDISSYDQLMIIHGENLIFYIYGYTHDFHDAEDLMIETFARIMAKKPHIKKGAFKAYLYKTARNLALRFDQKKRRVKIFDLGDISDEVVDSVLTEEILADKNRREILHMCLERIDPKLKEALWLV